MENFDNKKQPKLYEEVFSCTNQLLIFVNENKIRKSAIQLIRYYKDTTVHLLYWDD